MALAMVRAIATNENAFHCTETVMKINIDENRINFHGYVCRVVQATR